MDRAREGRETMRARNVEEFRLDLLGIGLIGDELTADAKRLRTLVMAAPLVRRFDSDRPDIRELHDLQLQFLEVRINFITARSEDELEHLAGELIWMDAHLSRSQSVDSLRGDLEDVP